MLKLSVTQGPDRGKSFTVGEDPVFLGRLNAPVLLSDPKVSRHHAQIAREGGGYVVRDVGSSNGTFVNGTRIMGSMPLHDGDKIQVGLTLLSVALAGQPAAAEAGAPAMPGAPRTAAPAPVPSGPLEEDDIVSMLASPPADEEDDELAAAIGSEVAGGGDDDEDADDDGFAAAPPAGRSVPPMRSAIAKPTAQPMRPMTRVGAAPVGGNGKGNAAAAPRPMPKAIPLADEVEDPLADTDQV